VPIASALGEIGEGTALVLLPSRTFSFSLLGPACFRFHFAHQRPLASASYFSITHHVKEIKENGHTIMPDHPCNTDDYSSAFLFA